ncbi:CsbD family protein [Lactobacillus kitasatonis]|uniref:CsbD family protein n=1 Tax=Lactobacillus kitasatonis TaxID=237446 RepID=A0ABS1LVL2_9LACO|nr:CsbD family protein [Lactobacillus kitasatonis]MBL1071799.1 CsbD family protein [Lactobacillus kitasatonis]
MSNMDSGLKDKIIGKAKEVEGKLTGDKSREVEGKAQKTKGKVKAKTQKVKDDIEADHQIDEDC